MKLDTKNRIAKRIQAVRGEAAFEMLGRATELERQGRSIIHLEIGEPDFDTPRPVVEAGIEYLKKGATHYAPISGIRELRASVARDLKSRHAVELGPENVLVTPGAKMMIFSIIQSIIDPGDEVIHPDPGYPAYEAGIRMAGATPVPVKLEESKEYRCELEFPVPLVESPAMLKLLQLHLEHRPPNAPILAFTLRVEPAEPRRLQHGLSVGTSRRRRARDHRRLRRNASAPHRP